MPVTCRNDDLADLRRQADRRKIDRFVSEAFAARREAAGLREKLRKARAALRKKK